MTIGFSKTFPLDRKSLSRLLEEYTRDFKLPRERITRILGVGSQKAEAMVAWIGMTGLRDNKRKMLTPIGKIMSEYDPHMESVGTQFVLHYQLTSNPLAEVWYETTNKFLSVRSTFSFSNALDFLVSAGVGSKESKHLRADLNMFIKSLLPNGPLGGMGLLRMNDQTKPYTTEAILHTSAPSNIPPRVIAYGLYNHRDMHSPNVRTISIKDALTQDGSVGRTFFLIREKLEAAIKLLSTPEYGQYTGLVKSGDIDQIELRFTGPSTDILLDYYRQGR